MVGYYLEILDSEKLGPLTAVDSVVYSSLPWWPRQ